MITKSQAKRKQDIKTKLMAAIAMLLVSSIMMVSSTYAWFTLSTAPEVTGIQTAVGANGNLEMALLNAVTAANPDQIATSVGETDVAKANETWGNLVDLSDATVYGLNQIVLNPAKLNEANGAIAVGLPLTTPQYGADGRVSGLSSNTSTSILQDGKFSGIEGFGVRAIGVSSGMTDRQISYRTYRSNAATSAGSAKIGASRALEANGGAIANLAVAKVTGDNIAKTDVQKLIALTDAILGSETGVDGVLEHIEKAYVQNIIAYFASGAELGITDAAYLLFEAAAKNVDTVADLKTKLTELSGTQATADKIDDVIGNYMSELDDTRENVQDAKDALVLLGDKENYTVAEVQNALATLVVVDEVRINGLTADEVKADPFVLASGSVTVSMGKDAGVFADIAQHCGNYSAAIKVYIGKVGSFDVNKEVDARMVTAAEAPFYLEAINTLVNNAGMPDSEGNTEAKPFSEFYGYIIDLAFRTNAADSKLLLQQEGIDRIYDQEGNEETMGKGSTMTFAASEGAADFTNDDVKALMGNIRVVFFDKTSGAIHAKAKLDMENDVQVGADGVTAFLRIYEGTVTETYKYDLVGQDVAYADGTTYYQIDVAEKIEYVEATVNAENFATLKENLYKDNTGATPAGETFEENVTYYQRKVTPATYKVATVDAGSYENLKAELYVRTVADSVAGESFVDDDNDVITDLVQNTPLTVSVLVYLDGESITNAHVSAVGSTSVTGTMNLQFSSSANLVPMDYAALQVPTTQGGGTAGGEG